MASATKSDSGNGIGSTIGGVASEAVAGADDHLADTDPGVTILAIQESPTADVRPGVIVFAPSLGVVARREVAESLAWFDRVDARRLPT